MSDFLAVALHCLAMILISALFGIATFLKSEIGFGPNGVDSVAFAPSIVYGQKSDVLFVRVEIQALLKPLLAAS